MFPETTTLLIWDSINRVKIENKYVDRIVNLASNKNLIGDLSLKFERLV